MDSLGHRNISEQTLCDVTTIFENAGTGSSRSRIETVISAILDDLSHFENLDMGPPSTLKTLHLLLLVYVTYQEDNGCSTEQAVRSLKISSTFLQKSVRTFDTTADTLCNVIHLSLLLMSSEDLAKNSCELISKCEEALSFYLTSETVQVDNFDPQVSVQLLSVILSAICKRKTIHKSVHLSDQNDLSISHDLVVQLALCSNDTLRAQTLLMLVPKILKHERKSAILEKLLNVIVTCQSEESLSRALAVLSALCLYYLPDTNCNLTFFVGGNNAFWLLIQRGLCSDTPFTRKHALYLIRRCVSCLITSGNEVNCEMFFWALSQKEELFNWWQDICTVLEVLEERAFHLISPVLSTLQSIFMSTMNKDLTHSCFLTWSLTAFRRLLQHSCIYVVKWGVDILIGDIGCDLISSKNSKIFCCFFLDTLLYTLNSPQIFYEVDEESENDQEIPELEHLQKYLVSAAKSESRQEFFIKLFDVMGTFNWAPISLFIFTKSLTKVPSFKCLNPQETPIIKRLVSKILATQNVSIRLVALQYLLVTLINLSNCERLELQAVLDILTAFYFDGNLLRGSELWNHTVAWISEAFQENQVLLWFTENATCSNYFPPAFAQLIALVYDAGLLHNFDCLESLFSLLSNCDTRLYVDREAQTRCVEVVAYMVKASESFDIQSFDKAREAMLLIVKATICNLCLLFKKRLFYIENLAAYHVATRLLKCLDLFCKDKDVALILSKEKAFGNLVASAFDIVEHDLQEKNINFVFAINLVKFWCKSQDLTSNTQLCERSSKILKNILHSNVLVEPPFSYQFSKLCSWSAEILGPASSSVVGALWEFASVFNSIAPTEIVSLRVVEAFDVGLNAGGRNLLPILLNILGKVLANNRKSDSCVAVLRNCWSNIVEVRHKDIFYPALREFLRAVLQPEVVQTQWGGNFVAECGQELLSGKESSYGVAGELAFALQNLVHQTPEVVLHRPIRYLVVSCFVRSTIQRRDQKLLRKITSSLTCREDSNSVHQFLRDDPFTFVRCTAVEMFLFLISGDETWRTDIADLLTEDLLAETETPEAKRARYFSNSLTHRIQLHVLQALMLVEPKTSSETKEALGKWLLKRLLSENHQLSVRYLSEWLLVRICSSIEKLRKDLLTLVEAGDIRESALCSVTCTLLHVSHTFQSEQNNLQDVRIFLGQFYEALLPLTMAQAYSVRFNAHFYEALLPLTMAQAYSVRFNAHVALLQVWEIMEKLGLTQERSQYKLSALAVRKSFSRASNKFQNHKDFYLTEFKCVEHYSLETIFYDMARLTHMSRDECLKTNLLRKTGISNKSPVPLINKDRRLAEFNPAVNRRREANNSSENRKESRCLQKKMVPSKWLQINELQVKSLPEVLRPRNSDVPCRGLVVAASLLDKASNLGGLSRTCEIMGVSLVLPKLSVASDREFQALSMSSEMWAPLSEVKPHELPNFMVELKKQGFTLVGAEQTAKSTTLNDFHFAENTLLLLGNECEGIPSNLLPLLDVCVEIPQYGLVRSLNVHVAGSLFIYEYRRQHSVPTLNGACTGTDIIC